VSPRIVRGTTSHDGNFGPNQQAFLNIELISEKTQEYWLQSIKEIKRDHPEQILIASVMAAFNEDDWKELVREIGIYDTCWWYSLCNFQYRQHYENTGSYNFDC